MATTGTTASEAFSFLAQGGIIQHFKVGTRDIVLSFPTAKSYDGDAHPFFGENIGRVANRISNARIDDLNGQRYELFANNGPHTVHGGQYGWGKKVFDGPHDLQRDGRHAVSFTYRSPHGEEGFPGTVELRMWYYPSVERQGDGRTITKLEIEYEVELVGGEVEETVVSLTNHSYFNISDGPTIEGTRAVLETNLHQVTDEESIPTGEIRPYPDISPGEEFIFGAHEPDIDHCFIISQDVASIPLDTRSQPLRKLITLSHPATNIHMEAWSTEPAFQVYAGRYIDVPAMDGMPARGKRSGICIEASRYINAVNVPAWRPMVALRKGQLYGSRTVYQAWEEDA